MVIEGTGANNLGLDDLSDDADDLAPLDVSDFTPKPPVKRKTTAKSVIRAASHDAGFHDRGEPTNTPAKKGVSETSKPNTKVVEVKTKPTINMGGMRRSRYYRTGRNTQLNIKVRLDDRERIKVLCDQQEWVAGQALEYAFDALEQKLKNEEDDFWQQHLLRGVE